MGTILLIGGIAVLAVVGVEFGLRLRAKRRMEEGMFDQGLPLVLHDAHPGDDGIGDHGAIDHVDPSHHPGDHSGV